QGAHRGTEVDDRVRQHAPTARVAGDLVVVVHRALPGATGVDRLDPGQSRAALFESVGGAHIIPFSRPISSSRISMYEPRRAFMPSNCTPNTSAPCSWIRKYA